jgi:hypothetical protein
MKVVIMDIVLTKFVNVELIRTCFLPIRRDNITVISKSVETK